MAVRRGNAEQASGQCALHDRSEMRLPPVPVRQSSADRSSQMAASIRNPMSTNPMLRFAKSLFGQVLIALLLGLLVGPFAPPLALHLNPPAYPLIPPIQ